MKRKALVLCLGVLATLSLSACQDDYHTYFIHDTHKEEVTEHIHEASDAWSTDSKCHWKLCRVCHEIMESTREEHIVEEWTLGEDEETYSGVCTVCGHELTTTELDTSENASETPDGE
ncbi:MAG: hypothetical protein LUC31_03585 [Coprobacillus sp.]|nr:hypothetical protein [Coprobacillus sp.]